MTTLGNRAKAARRAAQRRLTELGMQYNAATTEQTREAIQARINDINQAISETRLYSNGKRIVGRNKEQREAAVERLKEFNKTFELPKVSSVRRSNTVFRRNVDAVSRGETIEAMSQNQLRSFWRATQQAWEGKGSTKDRFKNIQKYYGTNDLQLIFDAIRFENADVIDLLNKVKNREQLSTEQKVFLQDLIRNDDDLEKRYRKNDEESPLIGMVASSIPFMSKARFKQIVKSAEFKDFIANESD